MLNIINNNISRACSLHKYGSFMFIISISRPGMEHVRVRGPLIPAHCLTSWQQLCIHIRPVRPRPRHRRKVKLWSKCEVTRLLESQVMLNWIRPPFINQIIVFTFFLIITNAKLTWKKTQGAWYQRSQSCLDLIVIKYFGLCNEVWNIW